MTTILLVEDNEMNRDMLSRRLGARGFRVLLAPDGETGVSMARAEHPGVILMDMRLPQMDGWKATQILKSGASTGAIPIIALTAHAMREDRERALQAGCDRYETKPVDFHCLLRTIEEVLSREVAHG